MNLIKETNDLSFTISNQEDVNKPQNKISVLIEKVKTQDNNYTWRLSLTAPQNSNLKDSNIIFAEDSRFGVILYYADYIRQLTGVINKAVKVWNYPSTLLEPEEGFDMSPYNGNVVAENQLFITLTFRPMKEIYRDNWSVIPRSTALQKQSSLTFKKTEFYYEGLFYFHNMQYLLGEIEKKPNPANYDFTLYRDPIEGHFHKPGQ